MPADCLGTLVRRARCASGVRSRPLPARADRRKRPHVAALGDWWSHGSAFARAAALWFQDARPLAPFDGLLHLLGGSVYT